jgi:anti-sigma factor RsiW
MRTFTIDSDPLLVAYVDGELDASTAQEVEAMLASDPRARRHVEMFRETASLLRAACDERLYAVENVSLPPRRQSPRVGPRVWAVAASLLAVVAGFGGGALWGGRAPSARAELIDEVAGYHTFHSRESRHLVEVAADQEEEIKAWMGGHLGRAIDVPDLGAAGLHFAGGRMFVVNERPVAELMYTREGGRPIGVCLTRMDGDPAPLRIEQNGAERLASWITGGYAYVVVGEFDRRTAENLAALVAAQES